MERKYDKTVDGLVYDIIRTIDKSIEGLKNYDIKPEDKEAYVTVSDKFIEKVVRDNTLFYENIYAGFDELNRPTLELSVLTKLKEAIENHNNLYLANMYKLDGTTYIEVKWRK